MLTLLIVLVAIVLMILLGVAVIGVALKLLWWAFVGLVIGALARLVIPGAPAIGWLGTVAAGILGALVGGVIGDALDASWVLELVLAVAIAALAIVAFGGARREYA
jgi:uncharacterized membrane protein YeaQ/YmgE (transglycosylase-associated protein family)